MKFFKIAKKKNSSQTNVKLIVKKIEDLLENAPSNYTIDDLLNAYSQSPTEHKHVLNGMISSFVGTETKGIPSRASLGVGRKKAGTKCSFDENNINDGDCQSLESIKNSIS